MLPSIVADPRELRQRQQAEAERLANHAAHLRQQRLLRAVAGMSSSDPSLQSRTAGIIPATELHPLVAQVARGSEPTRNVVHQHGLMVVGTPRTGATAVLDELEQAALTWGVRSGSFCGLPKLRVLCYVHLAAAIMHFTFFVTCLVVGADSSDPYIIVTRQQLLFTRKENSSCNLASLGTNETDIRVVGVDNKMPMNVIALSAMFFVLSCLFHSTWALGTSGAAPKLERVLTALLTNCCNPLRWLEFSASASCQFSVLCLITGLRAENDLANSWVLLSTVMFMGYATELISRPSADGQSWIGDDTRGRFLNFCYRLQIHVLAYVPYITTWVIFIRNFAWTLDDIAANPRFDVDDVVPVYIYSAVATVAVTFTSFTGVQLYCAWRPPHQFWKSEFYYAVLSLGSKGILGVCSCPNTHTHTHTHTHTPTCDALDMAVRRSFSWSISWARMHATAVSNLVSPSPVARGRQAHLACAAPQNSTLRASTPLPLPRAAVALWFLL
jgi:hypothetical protein